MIEKQLQRKRDPLDLNLQRWLVNGGNSSQTRGWLSPAELSDAVQLERERADRRDIEFSLLLLELEPSCRKAEDYQTLLEVLNTRLRNTDLFSRVDTGVVAVVLPDTPADGGSFVAAALMELAREKKIRFRCQIYVYPFFEDPDNGYHDGGSAGDVSGRNGQAEAPPNGPGVPRPLLFTRNQPVWKRVIDVVVCGTALVVVAPVMLAVAIAVKSTSRGPILFSQLREGRGGRIFRIYKFRTMRADAEAMKDELRHLSEQDGPAFKIKNDPRLTRIGKFLRRTCVDELPQLINVLRGEMTIVGPRPLPVSESRGCLRWQRRRLDVLPGMTCIWQVYGDEHTPFIEWMRMDLHYMRKLDFWSDTRLISQTVKVVLRQDGSA